MWWAWYFLLYDRNSSHFQKIFSWEKMWTYRMSKDGAPRIGSLALCFSICSGLALWWLPKSRKITGPSEMPWKKNSEANGWCSVAKQMSFVALRRETCSHVNTWKDFMAKELGEFTKLDQALLQGNDLILVKSISFLVCLLKWQRL